MGLLAKLTQSLTKRDAESPELEVARELEALRQEGRLHARQTLSRDQERVAISLTGGATGFVSDISYGGAGVRFPSAFWPTAQVPLRIEASLKVLDIATPCVVTVVRSVPSDAGSMFAGLSFRHEQPESLNALKRLIEPRRWGASLALIAQDVVNDRYRGAEWSVLRGEGPTDLILKSADGGARLAQAILTFKADGCYMEVKFADGLLSTGRSIELRQSGTVLVDSQMTPTAGIDAKVLRYAAQILLGSPASVRSLTDQLLASIYQALSI